MDEQDTPSFEVVLYRLSEVERHIGRFESAVDRRFESLDASIRDLRFVRVDVFNEWKTSAERSMRATDEKAASARAIAMWALGTIVTAVVVGLLGLLVQVATG